MAEVKFMGPDYTRLMRDGAPMFHSAFSIGRNSLVKFGMDHLGQEMANDPQWDPLFKALGVDKVPGANYAHAKAQAWQEWNSKELWRYGEYLYMQRYYKLTDRGMSHEDAMANVERYFPNYRLYSTTGPTDMLSSRALSRVMGDRNLVMFGKYEVAKFRIFANMIKDVYSSLKEHDMEKFREAAGRTVTAALLVTINRLFLDRFSQWATGNQQASYKLGGPFDLIDKGLDVVEHPSIQNAFYQLLNITHVAPASQEFFNQATGMNDFFTGQPLGTGGYRQYLAERGAHAMEHMFSPLGLLTDWRKYAFNAIGVHDPSPGATHFEQLRDSGGKPSNEKSAPWWLPAISGAPGTSVPTPKRSGGGRHHAGGF